MAGLSRETRHALRIIREYLAGPNESVQYALQFMGDLVTQASSGIRGGIPAGSVPSNDVVSDPSSEVFELDTSPAGSATGTLSLDLATGQLSASWTVNSTPVSVSGEVRCVETQVAPPADRSLFIVNDPNTGWFVLTTTNI